MNEERVRTLLEHMRTVPEDQFDYKLPLRAGTTIDPGRTVAEAKVKCSNMCGSVACVAGHCAIINWNEFRNSPHTVMEFAQYHLGITRMDANDLFVEWCGLANKADAIKRLEYLLANKTLLGYRFDLESHGNPPL